MIAERFFKMFFFHIIPLGKLLDEGEGGGNICFMYPVRNLAPRMKKILEKILEFFGE